MGAPHGSSCEALNDLQHAYRFAEPFQSQECGLISITSFRAVSGSLQRLIRRFHLCSGEKHADSDRALPTGVCLLSISRPPGETS